MHCGIVPPYFLEQNPSLSTPSITSLIQTDIYICTQAFSCASLALLHKLISPHYTRSVPFLLCFFYYFFAKTRRGRRTQATSSLYPPKTKKIYIRTA